MLNLIWSKDITAWSWNHQCVNLEFEVCCAQAYQNEYGSVILE